MQLIIGIIRANHISRVMENLKTLGIDGVTVSDVKGHGHQKGISDLYGDVEYVAEFVPKLRLEIIIPEAKAKSAMQAIISGGQTGMAGDGIVYSLPLGEAINIKTGESL